MGRAPRGRGPRVRFVGWPRRHSALGRGGFGPVTLKLIFLFSEYIQVLVNSKMCVGFV
jgi:hypothetical protein